MNPLPTDPAKMMLISTMLLHISIVYCSQTRAPNDKDNNNHNDNRKHVKNKEINSNNNKINENNHKNNNDCPENCVCSPTHRSHLKVTCTWPSIPGPEIFEDFPHVRTRSLNIRCIEQKVISRLPAGALASFSTLHHLAIHNCNLEGGKLLADQFKGLKQLRTFKMTQLSRDDNSDRYFNKFDTDLNNNSGGNSNIASENNNQDKNDNSEQFSKITNLILEPGCFNGCKRLEKLSLPHMGISTVPDNSLCGLQELKMLNLTGNRIASLKNLGGLGACSLQLILLDLSRNLLPEIPPGTLNGLKQLHFLHLEHNAISELKNDSFKQLASLQRLSLQGNRLKSFQVSLPEALPSLHFLDLSNNSLAEVPSSLKISDSLIKLNLSANNIETLPKIDNEPGLNLKSLQVLDLSVNKISVLSTNQIAKLGALKHLDLSGNNLANLSRNAISALPQLRHLNLARNKLSALNNESFHRIGNLHQLNLENNRLTSLSDNFFSAMPQISRLNLGSNRLATIPTALQALYYLSWLNLSNNSISTHNNLLFDRLHNLATIDLSHNRLPKIERQFLESVPKLVHLNLADNHLEDIDANAFHGSNNLRELHLQGNRLTRLKGFASNLPQLESLNISNNALFQLDYSMIPVSLKVLDASQNRLNRLTNFLAWNVSFVSLNLSHNNIVTLPDNILPPTLADADLSRNRLTVLPNGLVSRMSRLRRFDLRFNLLQDVNESSIALESILNRPTEGAYELYLVGNPLLCSCNMEWVTQLLPGTKGDSQISTEYGGKPALGRLPKLMDISDLSCSQMHRSSNNIPAMPASGEKNKIDPTTAGSVPFSRIKSSDLLCPYEQVCSDDCVCCDYERCDCKSECPPGCACYRDAAYATNIVRCSNNPLIAGDAVTSGAPFSLRALPMYATQILLDGVQIQVLTRHSFLGRFRLKSIHLNASGIRRIEPNAFIGLTSLRYLDLSNNQLEVLAGSEFKSVPRLASLDLSNNAIQRIEPVGFSALTDSLRDVKLHNNRLRLLPTAIAELAAGKKLNSLTLAGNPWACDCVVDKYPRLSLIQSWLPTHTALVTDNQALYCFENLTASLNTSQSHLQWGKNSKKGVGESGENSKLLANNQFETILKLLPPTAPNSSVVKVNFWAFLSDVVPQFCDRSLNSKDKRRGNFNFKSNNNLESKYSVILIVSLVCSLGLALFAVIFLLLWRFKGRLTPKNNAALKQSLLGVVRRRSSKSRISSATSSGGGSTHCTLPPLPGLDIPSPRRGGEYYSSSGGGASSSSPFLQYDSFLAYSWEESEFVNRALACHLEQELPYYELCLLHRDLPSSGGDGVPERHMINDQLIDAMERSQRIILVISEAFLRLEWQLVQIRTALQCVLKDSRVRRLIVILVGDVPLAEIDPMLGHYIRTNVCLQYEDSSMFWQKLREALPDKVLSSPLLNRTSSTELYGTIIPSDFV